MAVPGKSSVDGLLWTAVHGQPFLDVAVCSNFTYDRRLTIYGAAELKKDLGNATVAAAPLGPLGSQ